MTVWQSLLTQATVLALVCLAKANAGSVLVRASAASPPILRARFRVRGLPARSGALDRSPNADLFRARLTTDESLEPITLEGPGYLGAQESQAQNGRRRLAGRLLAGELDAARDDRDRAKRNGDE